MYGHLTNATETVRNCTFHLAGFCLVKDASRGRGLLFVYGNEVSLMDRHRKLLDEVREILRLKHYSYRTEQSYVGWIRRYILFHNKQHPKNMGAEHIQKFLTHLALAGKVTASTQNQAL